ncbi:MAG TPA: GNAT family N-acetyltransferase [Jatrophihabitans sp.]|nr:GNAT family N-acetyltransferase [Jatrophihabitans sp.]
MAAPSNTAANPFIRAAQVDDLPELLRLARAFYDEDGFTTSTAQLEANFRVLFADTDDAQISVAVCGGRSVGFALTTSRMILESGVVAELQDLYVEPAHRQRGIGTLLVDDAARWARARHATLLEVVVAPNGRDVGHLFSYYAARGFSDEGRRLLSVVL